MWWSTSITAIELPNEVIVSASSESSLGVEAARRLVEQQQLRL